MVTCIDNKGSQAEPSGVNLPEDRAQLGLCIASIIMVPQNCIHIQVYARICQYTTSANNKEKSENINRNTSFKMGIKIVDDGNKIERWGNLPLYHGFWRLLAV